MKTTKIAAALIFAFVLVNFLTGCTKKETDIRDDKARTEEKKQEQTKDASKMVAEGEYFCTMHPEQQTNDPEVRCPICKMKLTSKKDFNAKMMKKHEELETKQQGSKDLLHFEIQLSKLKSDECEMAVNKALKNTPGVTEYFIDILDSRVHALIDKNKTSKKDVEKVIADLGFDANDTKANADAKAKLPANCK